MTTSRPSTPKLEHGPIFSWYRDHNGFIFTSGHAAVDVDSGAISLGDLASEAHATLTNLRRTLERAGTSMDRVLKVTCYITDMSQFAAFNSVYAKYFGGPQPPARTCVEVSRLPFNFKVEIEVIAAAGAPAAAT
jgi:2-iminobutanoate/2-iminopropanoate deaminase